MGIIPVCTESAYNSVVMPTPDDAMQLTVASIKDIVVASTWKLVYAESEAEFEEIWDQMVEDALALGAQDVIDWFVENYKPNK